MSAPSISMSIDKRFGTREVLRAATLRLDAGTVHALVGENGAGKSTLVKILAGVLRGDGGTLELAGKPIDVATWTRQRARAAGIGIVQQHGAFAPTLTIVENAVLGVEPTRGPLLDLEATADKLAALGKRIGLPIEPHARAESLSLGAAQRAEIVASLHHGAKLLILDEPTAVLTPIEVDGLLATLRTLAKDGTTIIIVTHKLDEVRTVADAVTVLRAGQTVATFSAGSAPTSDGDAYRTAAGPLDVKAIARAMVGVDLPDAPRPIPIAADAKPVLVLDKVTVDASGQNQPSGVFILGEAIAQRSAGIPARSSASEARRRAAPADAVGPAIADLSLTVHAGELVGVAGVDGNGQRELALAIAGLAPHRGTIRLGERDVTGESPRARLAAGLAHIPEDRHHGGLVLDDSVADNLTLGRRDVTGSFIIRDDRVTRFAGERIVELDIRPGDPTVPARSLSGGNQQKVVVGRELSRPSLVAVVASQPTRGVDLGAVARIHDRLRAAAASGAGVLVISADLDELLSLCHRVVVLLRGQITGERGGEALREPDARGALGALMTGAGNPVAIANGTGGGPGEVRASGPSGGASSDV